MARVEPGQLRRWNRAIDADFGKLFVVLQMLDDEEFPIWNFIQDSSVRCYSEETILGWSEAIGD